VASPGGRSTGIPNEARGPGNIDPDGRGEIGFSDLHVGAEVNLELS